MVMCSRFRSAMMPVYSTAGTRALALILRALIRCSVVIAASFVRIASLAARSAAAVISAWLRPLDAADTRCQLTPWRRSEANRFRMTRLAMAPAGIG